LAVAFSREGGFENVGKNRWRLNATIPPESRKGRPNGENASLEFVEPKSLRHPGMTRATQIHEWLKENGPSTREQIANGSGVPDGTIGTYLATKKDLFEHRDGKWYPR
jgi:predicted HTH transcriptional regulator